MRKDYVSEWASSSPERQRLLAEETLILDVAAEIESLLEELGTSKSKIAEKLGTSKAYVSQVLSGSRNMTLRTLADLAWALQAHMSVRMISSQALSGWEISKHGQHGSVTAVRSVYLDEPSANDWDKWQSVESTVARVA